VSLNKEPIALNGSLVLERNCPIFSSAMEKDDIVAHISCNLMVGGVYLDI
jgi:hypothetical protein